MCCIAPNRVTPRPFCTNAKMTQSWFVEVVSCRLQVLWNYKINYCVNPEVCNRVCGSTSNPHWYYRSS